MEGYHCIDTAKLKQWRLLVPGVTDHAGRFEWRRGGEEKPSSSVGYLLTLGRGTGTLRLMYSTKSPDADLDYAVQVVSTRCHLGGVRFWFICPLILNGKACGRRVRKLYLRGKYFGCRHCHNLTYRSRQESDSRLYALLRGGLDALGRIEGRSVAQLGLTLKALTMEERRLARLEKQLCRPRRGGQATGNDRD